MTKNAMAHLVLVLSAAVLACESAPEGTPPPMSGGGSTGAGAPPTPAPFWGGGASAQPLPGARVQCFCDPGPTNPTPQLPSAIAELLVESLPGGEALHARLTLNPMYADNTYGANAVGWMKGHAFKDLVGSDAAALGFHDEAGKAVLVFHLDYLGADKESAAYHSLGTDGGDGRMVMGDPGAILRHTTSMSLNLNERGYGSFTTDSPRTDQNLTPDPAAPRWDFRVVYEAWVKTAIFGGGKLGFLNVPYLHVSPSKTGMNQTPLTPCACPPQASNGPPFGAGGTGGTPPAMCHTGAATCSSTEGNTCGAGSTCVGTCCVPLIP